MDYGFFKEHLPVNRITCHYWFVIKPEAADHSPGIVRIITDLLRIEIGNSVCPAKKQDPISDFVSPLDFSTADTVSSARTTIICRPGNVLHATSKVLPQENTD